MSRFVPLMALLVCLGVATRAHAVDADARAAADERYREATEHANARRYEAAIMAIEAAYALDPRPSFLFAWAQLERLSGDCPSAIGLYDRFVATGPSHEQVEAARLSRQRCERALATAPEQAAPAREPPAPAPVTAPPSTGVRAPAPVVPPPPAPRGQRWIVAGAVAAAAVGAGLLVAAQARIEDAKSPRDYDAYLADVDAARTLRWTGAAFVGTGVALAVIWAVRARAGPSDGVAISVAPDALTAGWRARF